MALFLLALAAWIAVRTARSPWPLVALVGLPLALAGATKYAALLFAPTVLALVVLAAVPERGLPKALLRGLLAAATAVGGAALVLVLAGHSFLVGLRTTTTARQAGTDGTGLLLRLSAELRRTGAGAGGGRHRAADPGGRRRPPLPAGSCWACCWSAPRCWPRRTRSTCTR